MNLDLTFERVIAAPQERVFDLFTSPGGQEALYQQPEPGWIVRSSCDLRVGGSWTIEFGPSEAEIWHHAHVFEAIDRPSRVRLRTTETRLDGVVLVTAMEFTFTPHDDGTLMRLEHGGFPTTELRDEHVTGLPYAFDSFARAAQ